MNTDIEYQWIGKGVYRIYTTDPLTEETLVDKIFEEYPQLGQFELVQKGALVWELRETNHSLDNYYPE